MSVQSLQARFSAEIEAAADLGALEAVRVSALGKSGEITELLKSLALKSDRGPRATLLWKDSSEERDRIDAILRTIRMAPLRTALEARRGTITLFRSPVATVWLFLLISARYFTSIPASFATFFHASMSLALMSRC